MECHYLQNKVGVVNFTKARDFKSLPVLVGVVDFAKAQGLVNF